MDGTAYRQSPMEPAGMGRATPACELAASNGIEQFASNSSSNKRLKTTRETSISYLPDEALLHISLYLRGVPRLFLATALTGSSTAWQEANWKLQASGAAGVIVSNYVKTWKSHASFCLDRDDEMLAPRLSDEDIGGALACLSAYCNIKTVRLEKCHNLTGEGLEPLRGSSTIETLDLSLVRHFSSPIITPVPKIAEECTIPILESIIDANDISLKHVVFPKKWREERSEMFVSFLSKYGRVMSNRNFTCSGEVYFGDYDGPCTHSCNETKKCPWINQQPGKSFGVHNYTCASCYSHFCSFYCEEPNSPSTNLNFCEKCELNLCKDCGQRDMWHEVLTCGSCLERSCNGCTNISKCWSCYKTRCKGCCFTFWCDHCDQNRCVDCVEFVVCEYPGCDESNCIECECEEQPLLVQQCHECFTSYCAKHAVEMLEQSSSGNQSHEDHSICSGCEERARDVQNLQQYCESD